MLSLPYSEHCDWNTNTGYWIIRTWGILLLGIKYLFTSLGCRIYRTWWRYRLPDFLQLLLWTDPKIKIAFTLMFKLTDYCTNLSFDSLTGACPLKCATKNPPWDPPQRPMRLGSSQGYFLIASCVAVMQSFTSTFPTFPCRYSTVALPIPVEPR